jgi:hypothetical protein
MEKLLFSDFDNLTDLEFAHVRGGKTVDFHNVLV